MIRLNFTNGDIKRALSARWGIRRRSVEKYLTVAWARNRGFIGEDENQSLARSLSYWSFKQQQSERTIDRQQTAIAAAEKSYQLAEKTIEELEGIRTADNPMTERFEILEMRKTNALQTIRQANSAMAIATSVSRECQDRIDRLKGNHAPIKFAKTDSKGNDVPAPVEPTTPAAVDQELRKLVDKLKERQGSAIAPSAN